MAGSERTRRKRTETWLAVLAVGVAAALLVAVLAVRLVPPGIRMAEHAVGGTALIGPTCTHYPGAEVSIEAPGAGTVVVRATVGVGVNHTFGLSDEARIFVADSAADCTLDNYTAFVSVPASLPSDARYYETIPLLRPFPISAMGTHTFYVNGLMAQGFGPGDRFDSASLVATYYPG